MFYSDKWSKSVFYNLFNLQTVEEFTAGDNRKQFIFKPLPLIDEPAVTEIPAPVTKTPAPVTETPAPATASFKKPADKVKAEVKSTVKKVVTKA